MNIIEIHRGMIKRILAFQVYSLEGEVKKYTKYFESSKKKQITYLRGWKNIKDPGRKISVYSTSIISPKFSSICLDFSAHYVCWL